MKKQKKTAAELLIQEQVFEVEEGEDGKTISRKKNKSGINKIRVDEPIDNNTAVVQPKPTNGMTGPKKTGGVVMFGGKVIRL